MEKSIIPFNFRNKNRFQAQSNQKILKLFSYMVPLHDTLTRLAAFGNHVNER